MTPISTKSTDIDEVLILPKAKRMNPNVRKAYSMASKRKTKREEYVKFLKAPPLRLEMFQRFLAPHQGVAEKRSARRTGRVEQGLLLIMWRGVLCLWPGGTRRQKTSWEIALKRFCSRRGRFHAHSISNRSATDDGILRHAN